MKVRLSEMRGCGEMTPAHQTDGMAELVCSNSFRSDDAESNAVGLLHAEMRALGSLIMRAADAHRVPAGSALAVDRDGFSADGDRAARGASQCRDRPRAGRRPPRLRPDDRRDRPADRRALAEAIGAATGADALAFFDAIAPIVHRDSIDMDVVLDGQPLGQGRDQGLHQLPDDEGAVSRLPPGPARRREEPSSRSGRRTRPISRAACRSR